MSKTFVLGAGFSAAEEFPLVRGLRDRVIRFLGNERHSSYKVSLEPGRDFRRTEFYDGLEAVDPHGTLGFEELLIALRKTNEHAHPQRASHTTARVLKIGSARLLWDIHRSISRVSPCYEAFAHRSFKPTEARKNAVVSFNWDVLFERSLQDASVPWAYSLQGPLLPVLKPHGSINWNSYLKAGLSSEYADWEPIGPNNDLSYDRLHPLTDQDPDEIHYDLRYMLFPGDPELPSQDASLIQIWSDVEKAIEDRDELIFIGYSLPEYDSYAAEIFQRFAATKKIEVYNPSDAHLQRFRTVLGKHVQLFPQTFAESQYAAWGP